MSQESMDQARPVPRPSLRRPASDGVLGAATETTTEDIQRWTARRRMALVLSILKGEITVEEGARRHRLTVSEIEEWRERMLVAAHNALRSRPRDEEALKDDQIRRLKQKVGELILDVDVLKEALRNARSEEPEAVED